MKDDKIFMDIQSAASISCAGNTWLETWNAILRKEKFFINPEAVFLDWPTGPPIGICKFDFHDFQKFERSSAMAYNMGVSFSQKIRMIKSEDKSLKIGAILATSHGESGGIGELVNHIIGKNPEISLKIYETILYEKIREGFLRGLKTAIPVSTVSVACASSLAAVSIGKRAIKFGGYDMIIVISVDCISRIAYAGFLQVGAISLNGCKPFDSESDGLTLSEGANAFLIGNYKVCPYFMKPVEILGSNFMSEPIHVVEPSSNGIAEIILETIKHSKCNISDIDCIYWHATGTKLNDEAETDAAHTVFGDSVPYGTGTKAVLGHTLGPSAGFNILAAGESIYSKVIPAAANVSNARSENLNIVATSSVDFDVKKVLVVASGFGGISSAVILNSLN